MRTKNWEPPKKNSKLPKAVEFLETIAEFVCCIGIVVWVFAILIGGFVCAKNPNLQPHVLEVAKWSFYIATSAAFVCSFRELLGLKELEE